MKLWPDWFHLQLTPQLSPLTPLLYYLSLGQSFFTSEYIPLRGRTSPYISRFGQQYCLVTGSPWHIQGFWNFRTKLVRMHCLIQHPHWPVSSGGNKATLKLVKTQKQRPRRAGYTFLPLLWFFLLAPGLFPPESFSTSYTLKCFCLVYIKWYHLEATFSQSILCFPFLILSKIEDHTLILPKTFTPSSRHLRALYNGWHFCGKSWVFFFQIKGDGRSQPCLVYVCNTILSLRAGTEIVIEYAPLGIQNQVLHARPHYSFYLNPSCWRCPHSECSERKHR